MSLIVSIVDQSLPVAKAAAPLYYLIEQQMEMGTQMHREDHVLVAIMPSPTDFIIAQDQGWYRIPQERAPKGVHAEYLASFFNRTFGQQ